MVYPDAEKLLVAWAAAIWPSARVCTETPADLNDVLPVIEIRRIGGSDDALTIDSPTVAINVYAADKASASDLAEQIRVSVRFTLPGTALTSGVVVSETATIGAPVWVPYDNTSLRKYAATYLIRLASTV